MSYFLDNYNKIQYSIATDETRGLRNAQLGAIYSIGSHFTVNKNQPAIIVLPTGSGKTAVLNLSAYLLRAKRVLVISSSILVRGQIVEEFETLKTLKNLNVFQHDLQTPQVKEIKSPIRSLEEWEALKAFDVVIGIPNSINEGIKENIVPPQDLFDLILVDEAHHVPAFTWSNVIKAFDTAKKVYFTATPFRRDKKEIEGKLVYIYSISKAYEDKIFGDIGYYPVVTDSANVDLAIAKDAERVFKQDRDAGLKHFLMVRTETKDQAESLRILYENNTTLKLKKVDSTLSYRTIKNTIQSLKDGELDGIICVDMLGEGFDFPNLKIAAIHSPKKSLANTLQFIGRFARTNAADIGEAKFLAIPSDIEIGKKRLYEEGAIWNDIIKNLSQEVIDAEDEIKTILDSFEKEEIPNSNQDELSFYNLNPYCHVKVYKAEGINLNGQIEVSNQEIVYQSVSREYNTIVFITKETEKPKWLLTDDLINVRHYFFLIYFDTNSELLFIHSSIKTIQFYDELVTTFALGNPERIPKYQINKVLKDIVDPEFFNIGMQNRTASSGESYRIIAGSNAETTIRKSHSKNYANGHVFLKGKADGSNVTVGYSSGSKVWSNAYEKIPNFIKWCNVLGAKIISEGEVKTNTGFDNLPIGKVVNVFPFPVHSANWHHDTFTETPFLYLMDEDELISQHQLLDFSIEIRKDISTNTFMAFDLTLDEITIELSYDFEHHFQLREVYTFSILVSEQSGHISIERYLNESPLQIFMDEFATLANHEYYEPPKEGDFQYEPSKIQSINWGLHNTDITKEFYFNAQSKIDNQNRNSIHETLKSILEQEIPSVLIYDHGSGEVADFITIRESAEKIMCCLYHVKGSTGVNPGDRVSDVYEVCMQAIKSQSWTTKKYTFKNKILDRTNDHPEKFIIGDQTIFTGIINQSKRIEFTFAIVQPGISQATFSPKLSHLLAATDDSINNSGYEPLVAIGS